MKIRIIRKKANDVRKKANKLVRGGHVRVDGHKVKLKQEKEFAYYCFLCPMDSICRLQSEMRLVCHECDIITGNDCYLQPIF